VVAEGERVGARREQLLRELRRDPRSVGRVLAVDDADVDVELLAEPRQPLLDGAPAGGSEDVAEEEDFQVSRSA
jgi:hypothetical protein